MKGTCRTRVSDKGTHVSDKGTCTLANRQISDRLLRKYKYAKTVRPALYRFFHQRKHGIQCLQVGWTIHAQDHTFAALDCSRLKTESKSITRTYLAISTFHSRVKGESGNAKPWCIRARG